MADAKRRKVDVVLVWKLDRFGRSLRHLVNALAEFESLNIAFVSLSDRPKHGQRTAHVQHYWCDGRV
jgi:DNA invertase Pin-like site-specific DNA recombinase